MSTDSSRGGPLRPLLILALIAALLASGAFALTSDRRENNAETTTTARYDSATTTGKDVIDSPLRREAPKTPPPEGVILPEARDHLDGYPTGFPHSDLGAAAAQAAIARAQIGFDYDQAAQVADIYAAPEAREILQERARAAVELRRDQAGVPTQGEVPAPASYALTPLAFTLEELAADYFAISLLSYASMTQVDGTVTDFLYTGTQLLRWVEDDWKVVQGSDADIKRLHGAGRPPPAAAPGTPEFEQARWILIDAEIQ